MPRYNRLNISVFEGVWYDGDVKPGLFYIKDGEADAVEADGAFFYDEGSEFFGEFEAEFPAAVEVFPLGADGGGVNVSLNDVTVQASIHLEASFQIDQMSGLPGVEVGLLEGLFDGGDPVGIVSDLFHGEADAVVGDTLVNFQFAGEGGSYPEGPVGAFGLCLSYLT